MVQIGRILYSDCHYKFRKLNFFSNQIGIKFKIFHFSKMFKRIILSILKKILVSMKKKFIIYSDLSRKQLETLKELYIQKKVESMSHQELKQYVLEIISHQINDTIGKEEEMEAWREMSDFFGEQFEINILEIQTKYIDDKNVIETEIDSQKQRIELLERNNLDQEKKDMWDD